MDINDEFEAALNEQRTSDDRHFVYLRDRYAHVVGLRAALAAEAEASGRSLMVDGRKSPAMHLAEEKLARRKAAGATIKRGDSEAFLKNLKKIAGGDVAVVD